MSVRDRFYSKALRRLRNQDSATVLAWAQTSLWGLQAGLEGYQANRDEAALDEALRGALGLLAAVEVLLDKERGSTAH